MLKCLQLGIVSGETGVADGSFLPSNVSWDSRYEMVETINRSTIKYMKELETELSSMPGYEKPENVETEKELLKSHTDPECGYIHQARKKGLGYLTEMTVDTSRSIQFQKKICKNRPRKMSLSTDPLFWDRGNWQPLCEHHHNVKTMTEDRYVEYRF